MKFFKKEKFGRERVIIVLGFKFHYRAGKNYKLAEIRISGGGLTEVKRTPKVIVSLTSFPARINYVYKAITSLLDQTFKPDLIILWLAQEQFPNKEKDLPQNLLELTNYGLSIRYCNDMRSYKKLIPALKLYPDDIIITVDDDWYYDKKMIELLYKSYLKNPEYIHCHRCTKIFFKDGEIKYKGGGKKYYKYPCFANKLCGCAGTLYPPHSLYKDVTNENLFMTLAPTNDDIWFWCMAVLNNTKIKTIRNNIPKLAEIDETLSGPCLTKINDHGKKLFYKDFRNVLNHYSGLEEKIRKDAGK